jgi:hypothetical protein
MTRQRRLLLVAAIAGFVVAITATGSSAAPVDENSFGSDNIIREQLSGFNEVPLALSTPGTASFRAVINDKAQEITYRLTYAAFPTAVTQSHVHFGSPAQSGGVSFFLCSNLGNGPAGTQACPAAPATITGTIKPADVIGPNAQGIAPGEFAEIVKAIRAGATYVNIHTVQFAPGEARAQLGHQH